jgi:hypothetical protein
MKAIKYLWAAPNSLLGLVLGLLAVLLGARARVHRGALEVGGGRVGHAVSRLPAPYAFSAVTMGHVILGVNHAALSELRRHEHVHVRQYERWGPLFLPAYFASSLLAWVRGRDPYRENHFEREAFALSEPLSARPHPFLQETAMDEAPSAPDAARRIDLTRDTDVNFWCRVFDVSREQLRDAVHHAGHQADAVERYLREHHVGRAA